MIKIYTYQMIGLADDNGRVYESKYGTYCKKTGITLSDISVKMLKEDLIEKLFHEDCWSLKKEPKKMTKEEIEKALGYEIEINEPKKDEKSKDNQSISKNAQKTQKNVFADDIFNFLFW